MNTYWRQISGNLQKKVNSGTYKVWIAPLRAELVPAKTDPATAEGIPAPDQAVSSVPLAAQPAVKTEPVTLRVFAPNEFVANWVRERLSDVIQAAAEEVLEGTVLLRIEASFPESLLMPTESIVDAAGVPRQTRRSVRNTEPLPAPVAVETSCSTPSRGGSRLVGQQLTLPLRMTATPFSWRYAFDGFVVGPCNDMAYAAARNMLPEHGAVDTLFVSAGPGLGKTHLTQAVGQALCAGANRRPKVEYLSAESFSNAFVQALKARDIDAFKSRFRDVDVLLLEDVHFLQGKEKMQVEVLSTVKALQERGSRVVLTSSFAPRELNNLDPTLVSRFCSGFLAGMEKPDFPTRRRILQDKARKSEAAIPDDVCDLMAERLTGDVRQLEGCLNNLLLRARMQGCEISLAMAADILMQYAQESPFLDLEAITRRVCEGFGLSPEQLACRSRRTANVTARNTVFYLARKHTDLSLQDIGEHFNRRHSTVLKGIATVERELNRETPLGRQIAATLSIIETRVRNNAARR